MVLNIFSFHPYLGRWSNLTNIFQMGWNHQLEKQQEFLSESLGRPAQSWRFWDSQPPKNITTEREEMSSKIRMLGDLLFFFGDFTIDFHWFWMSSIGFQETVDLDFLRSDYDTVRVYNRRITIDTGQIRSIFRSLNMTIPQHERTMEASKSPQSEFGTHHLI